MNKQCKNVLHQSFFSVLILKLLADNIRILHINRDYFQVVQNLHSKWEMKRNIENIGNDITNRIIISNKKEMLNVSAWTGSGSEEELNQRKM